MKLFRIHYFLLDNFTLHSIVPHYCLAMGLQKLDYAKNSLILNNSFAQCQH